MLFCHFFEEITAKSARCYSDYCNDYIHHHTWITGCKDGWYNRGVCGVGPEQGATSQNDEWYAAGWKKGQEHNPSRSGC